MIYAFFMHVYFSFSFPFVSLFTFVNFLLFGSRYVFFCLPLSLSHSLCLFSSLFSPLHHHFLILSIISSTLQSLSCLSTHLHSPSTLVFFIISFPHHLLIFLLHVHSLVHFLHLVPLCSFHHYLPSLTSHLTHSNHQSFNRYPSLPLSLHSLPILSLASFSAPSSPCSLSSSS